MDTELQKAIDTASAAAVMLLKSHVKATSYTTASGTVVNRKEYDDSRMAKMHSDSKDAFRSTDKANKTKGALEQSQAHRDAAMDHLHAMRRAHDNGDTAMAEEHKDMAKKHIDASTRGFGKDEHGTTMQAHKRIADAVTKKATEVNNGNKGGIDGTSTKATDSEKAKSDYHEVARHAHQKAADYADKVDFEGGNVARMLNAGSARKRHQQQADIHDANTY